MTSQAQICFSGLHWYRYSDTGIGRAMRVKWEMPRWGWLRGARRRGTLRGVSRWVARRTVRKTGRRCSVWGGMWRNRDLCWGWRPGEAQRLASFGRSFISRYGHRIGSGCSRFGLADDRWSHTSAVCGPITSATISCVMRNNQRNPAVRFAQRRRCSLASTAAWAAVSPSHSRSCWFKRHFWINNALCFYHLTGDGIFRGRSVRKRGCDMPSIDSHLLM